MRNIIITGGELFNKGTQAMTFITVDELKRGFPETELTRRCCYDSAKYADAKTGEYVPCEQVNRGYVP